MSATSKSVNAKPKRKALSKKVRFEVFKRDSFTCQYCGASAPEAVLNVDHIKPVAKGGTNRMTNLVTACFGCNSGKSDRELSDQSVVEKQKQQLDQLQERRNQLEMMMQWHQGVTEVKDDALDMVVDYFNKKMSEYGTQILNDKGVKMVRAVAKKYPFNDVLKAIDIGFDQYVERGGEFSDNISELLGKLGGICRNKDAKPSEIRVHYVKGILRNKYPFFNEKSFYANLVYYEGVDVERLVRIAKTTPSLAKFWSEVEVLANG